jgi:hypothetical protein
MGWSLCFVRVWSVFSLYFVCIYMHCLYNQSYSYPAVNISIPDIPVEVLAANRNYESVFF